MLCSLIFVCFLAGFFLLQWCSGQVHPGRDTSRPWYYNVCTLPNICIASRNPNDGYLNTGETNLINERETNETNEDQ
ncbi:hypothetical protein K439DRAFT_1630168 [Ramaria rubella]|nr:hypothetical protein K439DRAFT_1630168 [Ramaria rubella]